MRRIFSSVSAASARAVLVSAAFLAGVTLFPAFSLPGSAQAESDAETAFAQYMPYVPSGHGLGGRGAYLQPAFPQPLSPSLVTRYQAVFRVLREGNAQEAERLVQQLSETQSVEEALLLPDVLAEIYLRTDAKPTSAALRGWLKAYPSAPDVPAIRALLEKHDPSAAATLPVVRARILLPGASPGDGTALPADKDKTGFARNPLLDRTVQERSALGVHGAASALRVVDATPGMTPPYAAQLYGEVALSLLSQGHAREALRAGVAGAGKGGQKYGFPSFVAGLGAWREGNSETARHLFQQAANAPLADTETRAAASYWAARVAPSRHVRKVWLKRAATQTESFYGMLAARWLQDGQQASRQQARAQVAARLTPPALPESERPRQASANDKRPRTMGEIDLAAVMTLTEGRHFFALLQIGEQGRAEALARRMWPDVAGDSVRGRSLALVARQAGMSGLATQMNARLDRAAASASGDDGFLARNGAPSAPPKLRPRHGFRLDPALVYAVTWMESNFNAQAQSPAGARGLMQIRPQTASFVTASRITYDSHGQPVIPPTPDMDRRLAEPGYNLEVGQLYLIYLAGITGHGSSDAASDDFAAGPPERSTPALSAPAAREGDLLHVLASYNAGPGAILRWESQQGAHRQDPLFFMETLPNTETRRYVRQVLAATWVYARRMGVETPSLTALSRGEWPSVSDERHLGSVPS